MEAVQHALAAHDWERAAGLIDVHGQMLLARGQVPTVLGWLNTLPATVAQAHPFLDVIHAGALFNLNQLEEAEHRVQAVERSLSADATHDRSSAILGTTALIRAYIALFRGELARWLELARQALDILPAAAAIGRTSAHLDIASAFVISGDVTAATEHRLAAAVAAVRDIGERSTHFRGMVTLAELRWRQGRLHQAAATYREAARLLPDPVMLQATPNGTNYYFGLGGLLYECNDLEAAEDLLAQGRDMVRGRLLAEADATTRGYIALARLQQARGESRAALATLHEFDELARECTFVDRLITCGVATRAHLALMQGDLQTAMQWADGSGLGPDDDLRYPRELEYLTLARVRVAQGRSHHQPARALHDALHLLDRLLERAEAGGRLDSVIEILILHALARQAQADLPAALAALERALTLAIPEGYVRSFVDEGAPMAVLLATGLVARTWAMETGTHDHDLRAYVQQLLAVFHSEGIVPPGNLRLPGTAPQALIPEGEVLTEREREVLQLLVQGYSNQAIAQELVVAVGTVKRHVSNIMSKLGVQSRLEAVARARSLGLP